MSDTIPQIPFALISGSAQWGLMFPDDVLEPGVSVRERGLVFETPWGPSENWQIIEVSGAGTPDGEPRRILNVFAHGWPIDTIDHEAFRKVAWILQEAGVRKILADSTSGSMNRMLKPGDFIIPWDVLDLSQTRYSLSGKMTAACQSVQLFCPQLADLLKQTAEELWPHPHRVVGQDQQLVFAHNWGPRFGSRAEAHAYKVMGADAMNHSTGAEASLAREIGACYVAASFIVRWQDGIMDRTPEDSTALHEKLRHPASRISLRTMMRATLGQECGCHKLRTLTRKEDVRFAQNQRGITCGEV